MLSRCLSDCGHIFEEKKYGRLVQSFLDSVQNGSPFFWKYVFKRFFILVLCFTPTCNLICSRWYWLIRRVFPPYFLLAVSRQYIFRSRSLRNDVIFQAICFFFLQMRSGGCFLRNSFSTVVLMYHAVKGFLWQWCYINCAFGNSDKKKKYIFIYLNPFADWEPHSFGLSLLWAVELLWPRKEAYSGGL